MLLSTWIGLWPFGPNVPSAFLHSRGRTGPVLAEPGNVGHGRLVSDQRSCRESGKEGEKPCVQHSDDLLLRLCSQRRRRQLCFPAQRKPDGDGVVAVGAGAGSVLASEPACFS